MIAVAKRFIVGMQVHFLSELLDEGIDAALETMSDVGGVNTLMLLTNVDEMSTLSWGKLSHNPTGRRFLSVSGFTYEPHLKYYSKTKMKPKKIDENGASAFHAAIEAAENYGMERYAFILHRFPFFEEHRDSQMVDALGRQLPGIFCYNNPEVRNLYLGMVEDLLRSYDLDGIFLDLLDHSIQFGFRTLTDEMANMLGLTSLPYPEMGLACFCKHCRERAEKERIDVEKVRRGLLRGVSLGYIPDKVERLARVDEVFRFLAEVPEYLEWLRFRMESNSEIHEEIHELVKSIDPSLKVALDIYSISDSWKYAADWKKLVGSCEWIKPMFYSGTYPGAPFPPERIYSETIAAIEETSHIVGIAPGVNACALTPEDVSKSVEQALKAGADGVVVSWDYALIPLESMSAARKAIEKQ